MKTDFSGFFFFSFISKADLRKKMVEEQEKNHLSGEILCEMQTEELAGNSQTLKEPGKSFNHIILKN